MKDSIDDWHWTPFLWNSDSGSSRTKKCSLKRLFHRSLLTTLDEFEIEY